MIVTERPFILDLGCGFGDLNFHLAAAGITHYQYLGVDVVPEFVESARTRWKRGKIEFVVADFHDFDFPKVDYVIGSGLFNHKLEWSAERDVRRHTLQRAFDSANHGVAFDFLTSNVDFELPHTFHHDPCEVLGEVSLLTKRFNLLSDYMPFEFAVLLFKDNSYGSETRFTPQLHSPPPRDWSNSEYH